MDKGQYFTLLNTLKSLKTSSALNIQSNDASVELRGRNRQSLCRQKVCYRTPPKMNGFFDPYVIFENGKRALAVYDYDFAELTEEFTPSVTMNDVANKNRVNDDLEYEWVVAAIPMFMIKQLLEVAYEYYAFSFREWNERHNGKRDTDLVWVAFLKATHDSILAAKAAKEAAEAAEAEAEAEAEAAEAEADAEFEAAEAGYAYEAKWYE